MAIRNQHWYNLNEGRSFPLSEDGTLLSDAGVLLPPNIITDINLRYPEDLGTYPFLGSITVSETLVALTIQAATSLTGDPGISPVATLSVPKSQFVEGRQIPLEPQAPGAGGWITLGSGVQETYSGRFSGPDQALIAPRAARPYRVLPVSSLGKLYRNLGLQGVVQLRGRSPIEIVKEERDIAGVLRDVIVVRLIQPEGISPVVGSNVFEEFAGPCGKRPESETCGEPTPIEFVNSVAPDCDGNITLEFRGCATISEILEQCGIVVDCQLGLIDACRPDRLPDSEGRLPNEYPDLCASESISEVSESSESAEEPESPESEESESESEAVVGELPYTECFDDLLADNWKTKNGGFVFVADDSPTEICPPQMVSLGVGDFSYATEAFVSATQRNIAVWDGFDTSNLGRRIFGDVRMQLGPAGAKRNAGIIVNYRPHPTIPSRAEYFLVQIDYDRQMFEVFRFNGTSFVPLPAFATIPGLALNHWYRIRLDVEPATGDNVQMTAVLDGVTNVAIHAELGPFLTGGFFPDDGLNGLHTDRAQSRFSFFRIEELP